MSRCLNPQTPPEVRPLGAPNTPSEGMTGGFWKTMVIWPEPQKWWFADVFPFPRRHFRVPAVSFREFVCSAVVIGLHSRDNWAYPYQRTPMEKSLYKPYIEGIYGL